ncbi:MAG: TRAM domain-containing protein [Chloroflexi bacterium]|nr:TRAM domain-containing protein [Chloroflexota bacterium]MCC6893215.1 TRAM domain-containing protein [Anaerolineae bacterium]
MTIDFISRMIGTVVFALLGARFGVESAGAVGLPVDITSAIFALVGVLIGLILTPWLTIRPLRRIRQTITELPVDMLLTSLAGMSMGLLLALLLAYPLAQLEEPWGELLPAAVSLVAGYLGLVIFRTRSREIVGLLGEQGNKRNRGLFVSGDRTILLDTSVLIDGRIVDIAKTGFIGGTLGVPRFVITELHQVADSSDTLRRNRGRHGLTKLNELQRDAVMPFKILEEDIPGVVEVDDKLVALAVKMNAPIITNDYPLNRIAETQGVTVLNVNSLSNAVRSIYLPGDTLPIRIIQEGREPDQGVGYLEDGTMVVVEGGKPFMDRTITVSVTKFINKDTGRMFFAVPDKE